jgi:hypothetical protein
MNDLQPTDEPDDAPLDDEVPHVVGAVLWVVQLLLALLAAIVAFVGIVALQIGLGRLGIDGVIADVVMYATMPGIFVAAGVTWTAVERLQQRRLRAVLLPASKPGPAGLSAGTSPTGVPVQMDRAFSQAVEKAASRPSQHP